MTVVRRSAGRAARQLRSHQSIRQQRRWESHDSHAHHSSSSAPPNESLGLKFWLGLGIFPVSYVVYSASRPGADGSATSLTQRIGSWASSVKETAERRNTSHTQAIEQAAADRHLFNGSEGSKKMELGFPEVFNTGSPMNVPAGHYSDIGKVIEHYKKENAEQAAKIQARLAAGKQLD